MAAGVIIGLTAYFTCATLLGKLLKMADDGFDRDGLS